MNEFSKEMEIRDEKIQVLEREMKIKDDKLVNLETSLAIIRNPPYLNLCASQHVFAGVSQAISYESIFFSAYNEEWQDRRQQNGDINFKYYELRAREYQILRTECTWLSNTTN